MPTPWLDMKMSTMTEMMEEAHSDMNTEAISTETQTTLHPSASLLCTNEALILYMHSLNSVFAFTNKYFNVETHLSCHTCILNRRKSFLTFMV